MEQCRRYDGLIGQCKVATGSNDLAHLARALPAPTGRGPIVRRPFVPPQPPPPQDQAEDGQDVQTVSCSTIDLNYTDLLRYINDGISFWDASKPGSSNSIIALSRED